MGDNEFEQFLRVYLPFLDPAEELGGDADLRDLGLDSLGTVELLARLEAHYDVRFIGDALRLETFATPSTIWTAVSDLRAARASG